MATDRHRILVSFTPAEFDRVRAQAGQFQLSISEMLRRFALGHHLPDPRDFAAAQGIRGLLKVNADQARLGNLLLMALEESDSTWPPELLARVDRLVVDIRATQDELKGLVKDLHRQIHPRATR